MIEELFRALEDSGANAGPEELADILWLAARIGAAAEGPAVPDLPEADGEPADAPLPDPSPTGQGGAGAEQTEEFYNAGDATDAPGPARQRVDLVRVRRAASVREPLALMRALRPLGRSTGRADDRNGPWLELDEELTVHRTVEQRLPIPVLRPRRGRWLDLALVVDAHHSMLLWHDLVAELRRVFVQTGIFRDVRTWYLRGTGAQEPLYVARTPDGEPRSVQEVSDPSGHRLVLVITDTVAGGWAGAEVAHMLRQWAGHGPVALLNVLPRRLWDRGAVRPRAVAVRSVGPASPNTSWRQGPARRTRRLRRPRAPEGITIPVVEATPDSVSALAKLVAGNGQWMRVPCLTVPRAPMEVPAVGPEDDGPLEVGEILRRFRAGASPLAQRLAGYLSAVPLSLPVMNLVRQIMLPEAEHGHLAEVALGGLFVPWGRESAADPDQVPFAFLPGVGEALLGGQRRDAITSVQQVVRRAMGAGVSELGAASGGDFLAGRGAGEAGGERGLAPDAEPFAARAGAGDSCVLTQGEGSRVPDSLPPLQPMPELADRYVDERLREVMTRAQQGRGDFVLLVGEPGVGKTMAMARAVADLPDDWTWWAPTEDELVGDSGQVRPRTVVVVAGFRSFSLAPALSELRELVRDADRGPIVVLGEMRTDDVAWIASGESVEARALSEVLGSITLVRVYSMDAEAEVMRRVYEAPEPARTMLRAALDIRRLGHGPALSRALLEAATIAYSHPDLREAQQRNWISRSLHYAREMVAEELSIMSVVARDPDHFHLSRFVEWVDRQEVSRIDPPDALWAVLARLADPQSLEPLTLSARERGLDEASRLLESASAFHRGSPDRSEFIRQLAKDAERRLVRIQHESGELGTGVLLSGGQVVMDRPGVLHPDDYALLRIESAPWASPRSWFARKRDPDEESRLTFLSPVGLERVPDLPPLTTAAMPEVGAWVLVVALPHVDLPSRTPTLLRCRVTALQRDEYLLRPPDSASLPTSGAAVVDLHGTVIGLVSPISVQRGHLVATRLQIPPAMRTPSRTAEPSTPALLDPAHSHAVVLSVQHYENFQDLPGATRAAHLLLRALALRGDDSVFHAANVSDITADRLYPEFVRHTLRAAARQAEHTLFLYYTGHVLETPNDTFLTFPHTSDQRLDETALSIRWLNSLLEDSPARFKVLVLDTDAKHTERIGSWLSARGTPQGNWTLLASQWQQTAPHAFTNVLASVLTDGIPGGPEFLTLSDIHFHIRQTETMRDVFFSGRMGSRTSELSLRNPAVVPPAAPQRPGNGTVKWFNKEKGFGFVALDNGPDVFVHYSVIDVPGFRSLEVGQRVQLRFSQSAKGPQAEYVRPIPSEPERSRH